MTGTRLRRGNWSVQELERLRHLLPRRGVDGTAALLRRSAESVRHRAVWLFRQEPRRSGWTDADDRMLRLAWGAVEPRLLCVMVGRPLAEVQRRAAELRRQPLTGAWTRAEDRALKALYGTRADADLEVCLLRPAAAIAAAARRLCLSKDKRFAKARRRPTAAGPRMPRWTTAQVEQLRALYADLDNLEVARRLGRSVTSVANKAWQLGLKKSAALLARIGRDNIAVRHRGAAAIAQDASV